MALRPPSRLLSGGKTSADSVATFRTASAAFCTVVSIEVLSGASWVGGVNPGLARAAAGSATELVFDEGAVDLDRSRCRRESTLTLSFFRWCIAKAWIKAK